MITEDYVSFETAKLLKEKGFDADITTYRDDFIQHGNIVIPLQECLSKDRIKTPTLQMAMKWLREVHNLWCEISWEGKGLWCMEVFSLTDEEFIPGSIVHEIKSYEEASEAGIRYCLQNLI